MPPKPPTNPTREHINGYIVDIILNGPTRIVTASDGATIQATAPPWCAAAASGLPIDVVFIREDGFSIGVCYAWARAASRLYGSGWAAVVDLHNVEGVLIRDSIFAYGQRCNRLDSDGRAQS